VISDNTEDSSLNEPVSQMSQDVALSQPSEDLAIVGQKRTFQLIDEPTDDENSDAFVVKRKAKDGPFDSTTDEDADNF